jgi:hypothetical protein
VSLGELRVRDRFHRSHAFVTPRIPDVIERDRVRKSRICSKQLKEASQQEAVRLGRANRYLEASQTRKEPIARALAQKQGIEEGLICVLRTLEPCISYEVYRYRELHKLELQRQQRKCLWIYQYWIDAR